MLKSNISLVKKNDSWVPKKEQQLSAIEKHGYTLTKTLGEGAYAKVKLADSKKHNCQVAVKVINKRRAPKDFLKKFLPREVHLMHRLDHPNVVGDELFVCLLFFGVEFCHLLRKISSVMAICYPGFRVPMSKK